MKTPLVRLLAAIVIICVNLGGGYSTPAAEPNAIDFRYAPEWWQTSICLPDDWQKTLVGQDGSLLYDFPGPFRDFATRLAADVAEGSQWTHQSLASPRVPLVQTLRQAGDVQIQLEAYAVTPESADLDYLATIARQTQPRFDWLVATYTNISAQTVTVSPTLTLESKFALEANPGEKLARLSSNTVVALELPITKVERGTNRVTLYFAQTSLAPKQAWSTAYKIARFNTPLSVPPNAVLSEARQARQMALAYWNKINLPYGHIEVPDAGVQALLDSSIRNIYQAREIKKGLPAFQVGPTCYRGLWVVDGSFLLEAVTFLGREVEARAGIQYLLSFQRADGSFMIMDNHWKETGIVLWAATRHARLTNDKEWLRRVWPQLQRGFAFIQQMRADSAKDPNAPNAGLIPDGFSDGGLGEKAPEYTNIYWTLAGLKAFAEAAQWLGQSGAAEQHEYADMLAAFQRAAARDTRTDAQGHRYVPIRMNAPATLAPQRAQWAFLHAVYPGQVFAANDPLAQGNMAMLEAVENEGLVFGTGWLEAGLWNYFGSFYGHAWLWLGRGEKAVQSLYAFGNHASPLLCWREEQMPKGKGPQICGDMPHNWASAEFIRLTRHAVALERGQELHLAEALPAAWIKPGATVRLKDVLTEFGPLTLELKVARNGRGAELRLEPPRRSPPSRIVLHLDNWAGRLGTLDLPVDKMKKLKIPLGTQR